MIYYRHKYSVWSAFKKTKQNMRVVTCIWLFFKNIFLCPYWIFSCFLFFFLMYSCSLITNNEVDEQRRFWCRSNHKLPPSHHHVARGALRTSLHKWAVIKAIVISCDCHNHFDWPERRDMMWVAGQRWRMARLAEKTCGCGGSRPSLVNDHWPCMRWIHFSAAGHH